MASPPRHRRENTERRTINEFGADNNGHRMWVIFVQILTRILYFFIVRAITVLDKSTNYVNNKVTLAGFVSLWKLLRGLNTWICEAAAANKQESNKFPSIFSLDSPRFFPLSAFVVPYWFFLPLTVKLFFPCIQIYILFFCSRLVVFNLETKIDRKLTNTDFWCTYRVSSVGQLIWRRNEFDMILYVPWWLLISSRMQRASNKGRVKNSALHCALMFVFCFFVWQNQFSAIGFLYRVEASKHSLEKKQEAK